LVVHVLVVGAGAIGGVLGARLSDAGVTVTLVGRPGPVRAIREHGLVVEGVGATVVRPQAEESVGAGSDADVYLVAVKTFDLDAALSALAAARPPRPTLLVQNGLGVEAVALEALGAGGWREPARYLVRAVQSVPATALGPGRVRATGVGEIVLPDPARAGPAAAAVRTVTELLRATTVPVRVTGDFEREVWRKLLVNAAINPVTAIHGVVNGAVLDEPLRTEALVLLEEARLVAGRAGVAFAREEAIAEFERVARATATNRSSMLQDVERGRPTEIDAISGELVRRGRAVGVALPATDAAREAVVALAGRRPQPL
jgi:2-dehydropantoate 2-reductase